MKVHLLAALLILLLIALNVLAQDATPAKDYEDFDYENFDNPTQIDNPWFPLQPGTQFVYEGATNEDGEMIDHQIIFTVTDLTKVIDGIQVSVIWDRDYANDELVETELAFFAQDNDGTVWLMGEYPEEYEDGELVAAPTWIAGIEDARAGIAMKADPQAGEADYSQGWGPAVDWTDRGQIFEVGLEMCVPFACYENVMVIRETSRAEPDAYQLKYYAETIGNIAVGWQGEDLSQEELALVELIILDEEALAEVREQALELEASGYETSPDVYGTTAPAEPMASASE